MSDEQKIDDSDSQIQQNARRVRKNWFQSLPEKQQDAVIKPTFEKEFPTHTDKREATKEFG